MKPLTVKNFKTTKNIFLNDDQQQQQQPFLLPTPSNLKKSHQFIAPVSILPQQQSTKLTVRFNDHQHSNSNGNGDTSSRDSIASNDSNDTIIEADISSLSNIDQPTTKSKQHKKTSSKDNHNKSDFYNPPQQQFYFNPDNLTFTIQPNQQQQQPRRNSMPNSTLIPIQKQRHSMNVTDL